MTIKITKAAAAFRKLPCSAAVKNIWKMGTSMIYRGRLWRDKAAPRAPLKGLNATSVINLSRSFGSPRGERQFDSSVLANWNFSISPIGSENAADIACRRHQELAYFLVLLNRGSSMLWRRTNSRTSVIWGMSSIICLN